MRKHSVAKLGLLCSILCVVALCVSWARAEEKTALATALPRPTTLVLLRHAEKDPAGDARDPGLSAAGLERAQRLAHLLGSAGVTHLFATEYHRTQDTLAPLAAKVQKKVEVIPGAKAADLRAALEGLPGGSIAVVAGHSNTVPAVAAHFGVLLPSLEKSAQGAHLPEDAYDRLYVITLPPPASKSAWSLLEMRY